MSRAEMIDEAVRRVREDRHLKNTHRSYKGPPRWVLIHMLQVGGRTFASFCRDVRAEFRRIEAEA